MLKLNIQFKRKIFGQCCRAKWEKMLRNQEGTKPNLTKMLLHIQGGVLKSIKK